MLIKFEITNFCSFRDNVEFSLIPSREKQHRKQHTFDLDPKTPINDLLRIGVFYGENASGKSNFIKAMEFSRRYITRGVAPKRHIGNRTFKLDEESRNSPSRFYFEILIDSKAYSYEFVVLNDEVLLECLQEILKTKSKLVYKRENKDGEFTTEFGTVITKLSKEEQQFYKFTADGTRTNQLFLTESVERNAKQFESIYNWFDKSLKIFTPKTISSGVEFRIVNDVEFTTFLKELLLYFDPSITGIESKSVNANTESGIPAHILSEIENEISEDDAIFISNPMTGERTVISKDKETGNLQSLKILTKHKCIGSDKQITFELKEESDGTRRIIELAPLFYELISHDECTVAFIDELDRSLHPLLTKDLIKLFLKNNRKIKSQIIVSTHDTDLLDTTLLRRDTIWFIKKNEVGISKLSSLQRDYKPRYDKDIRKDYLEGLYNNT